MTSSARSSRADATLTSLSASELARRIAAGHLSSQQVVLFLKQCQSISTGRW